MTLPSLTTILNNLPAYVALAIAIGTSVAVVLGTIGLVLSKLGTALLGVPWAPVRAVGHFVFFLGDTMTSIYSHWPDIAASLGNFAKLLKPGPKSGSAVGMLLCCFLLGDVATGCAHPPKLPDATELAAARAQAEALAKKLADAKERAVHTSRDALVVLTAARELAIAAGQLPPDIVAKSGDVLTRASAMLDRIERGEKVAKAEIMLVLVEVEDTLVDLRQHGAKVDNIVDSAIELAQAVVGDV
jgi:hypothetical protein